ncbi:MAG: transposase [Isosphaeraceae bacterium]
MLDETIITETPPLYCCYGHIGEQVRVPISGDRAKRIPHGAINVGTGDVALLITEEWTKQTHRGFLSMVRAHWRGWNIVLLEDRAGQHTAPDSRAWADDLGIEVRLLPKAAPELNAMDHLWRHTKREALGDRETMTIEGPALDACQDIIDLSPRDRLRKAGVLSGNFWLTKERVDQGASGHPTVSERPVSEGVENKPRQGSAPGNESYHTIT